MLIIPAAASQTYTKKSGNFSDKNIWTNGIPQKGTTAVILPGHAVRLNKSEKVGGVIVLPLAELNFQDKALTIENYNFIGYGNINAQNGKLIFSGSTTQRLEVNKDLKINTLEIKEKGHVVITGSRVLLTGTLNIQNGTLVTNNKFTLVSSASGTGKIAPLVNGAIKGNITVQQYIYSNYRLWRYLSSPVQNATIADWQNEIPVTGNFPNPSTGPDIKNQSPSIYYYDQTKPGNMDLGYIAYPINVNSNLATITPGRGYSVFVRDNADRPEYVDVTGVANTGNQYLPVSYTVSTGGIMNDGWNLVGNPYACPINWSKVEPSRRVGLDNAVYFGDNSNGTFVQRSYVNGVGNPRGTTGLIATSQGFWVKANSANPILLLKETDKVLNNASFYRTSNTISNILRLIIEDESSAIDEAVLRVYDSSTTFFDTEYDALKLGQSTLKIASKSSDDKELSINSFPATDVNGELIHIVIDNVKPGKYTLSFDDLETMEGSLAIYLQDNLSGEMVDIREIEFYPFEVTTEKTTYLNRFSILINQNTVIAEKSVEKYQNFTGIYPNPCNGNEVTVTFPAGMDNNVSLIITDLSGKELFQKNISGKENVDGSYSCLVDIGSLSPGIFTLIIKSSNETFIEKLIVK